MIDDDFDPDVAEPEGVNTTVYLCPQSTFQINSMMKPSSPAERKLVRRSSRNSRLRHRRRPNEKRYVCAKLGVPVTVKHRGFGLNPSPYRNKQSEKRKRRRMKSVEPETRRSVSCGKQKNKQKRTVLRQKRRNARGRITRST